MRGGRLRHRLVFKRPVEGTADAHNSRTRTYPDSHALDFIVWGEVRDLSGNELLRAQQINSDVSTSVVIRYREGITTRHVIEHRGRVLELVGPPLDSEGRRRTLELLCKEAA